MTPPIVTAVAEQPETHPSRLAAEAKYLAEGMVCLDRLVNAIDPVIRRGEEAVGSARRLVEALDRRIARLYPDRLRIICLELLREQASAHRRRLDQVVRFLCDNPEFADVPLPEV